MRFGKLWNPARRDVQVVSLAELASDTKAIEVLRTGTFVDSQGKKLTFTAADLETFVANFEAGAAGQDVPFDIDHAKSEAAGWVKGLFVEGEILKAIPDWNELGRKLIGDKVYRYISASVDMAKKVIKSLSLVNFPAVKGLDAVELAEMRTVPVSDYLQARIHKAFTMLADDLAASGILSVEERIELSGAIGSALEVFRGATGAAGEKTIEVPVPEMMFYYSESTREGGDARGRDDGAVNLSTKGAGEMPTEEELREQVRQELLQEMQERENGLATLRAQVRGEVEAEMTARFERRQGLADFAQEVCSGEHALSAKPADLVAFLEGLDDDQVAQAQALLRSRVVDFSERGSERDGQAGKTVLPAEMGASLRAWLGAGQELAEFFTVNREELGAMEQYDLSEFEVTK